MKRSKSYSVMFNSLQAHGLYSLPGSSVHGILQATGDLPNPGIKPRSPTLQADSLLSEPPGKPFMHVNFIDEDAYYHPYFTDQPYPALSYLCSLASATPLPALRRKCHSSARPTGCNSFLPSSHLQSILFLPLTKAHFP